MAFSSLADELGGLNPGPGSPTLTLSPTLSADTNGHGLASLSTLGGELGRGFGDPANGMSLADEFEFGNDDMGMDIGVGLGMGLGTGLGSLASELEQDLDPHAQLDLDLEHANGHSPRVSSESNLGEGALHVGASPRTPSRRFANGIGRGSPTTPVRSVSSRIPGSRSRILSNGNMLGAEPDQSDVSDDVDAPTPRNLAIEVLTDTISEGSRLVGLLQHLDSMSMASTPGLSETRATPRSLSPTTPRSAASTSQMAVGLSLEERLAGHLSRVSEAERAREEQSREIGQLLRELENVRWDALEELDLEWITELGQEDDAKPSPGWTGETRRAPIPNGNGPSDARSKLSTIPSEPASPTSPAVQLSPESSLYLGVRGHSRSGSGSTVAAGVRMAAPPACALTAATAEVLDTTSTLATSLANVSDAANLSLALSSGVARQVRGVRVGVSAWREREAAEEECQRGVDLWEQRVNVGDVPDIKREMGQIVVGFKEKLEAVERDLSALGDVRGRARRADVAGVVGAGSRVPVPPPGVRRRVAAS